MQFTIEDFNEFINRRFPDNDRWCNGNCYYFALILQDRFPGGAIFYDVVDGHFVYKYGDNCFDNNGVLPFNDNMVEWNKFDEYDFLQKQRIIRDCLM